MASFLGLENPSFGVKLSVEPPPTFSLRPYQQKVVEEISQKIDEGFYRILAYGPTGSGKTATFCYMIASMLAEGKRIMLLMHREFLIEQTKKTLMRFGVKPEDIGIIKAGYKENRLCPLQLAGIQSLARREHPEVIDVVIIDECHTCCWYSEYSRICESFPTSVKIGFSASPWRLQPHKEYFGQWFDTIVMGPSIEQLMKLGYLSRVRYFGYGGVDFSNLQTDSEGDFKASQVAQQMIEDGVCQKAAQQIKELCEGRTGVIFNAGVEQSKLQTQLLNDAGIVTKHIDANTPIDERRLMFQELANHDIDCISSVGCLTEGFDVPSIGYIVLARATKSKALYYQVAGRGLRISPGKENCFLLDFGGNVSRHGWLTKEQLITLEPSPPPDPAKTLKPCPEEEGGCGAEVFIFARVCPECGFEFPEGEKPDPDEFEAEFGELFDPETYRFVKYARSQRKTRYTKKQEPDKLWSLFKEKFEGQILFGEWLYGCIFSRKDTPENRQSFVDYLKPFAPTNDVDSLLYKGWMRHHLDLEFGAKGHKHRIGKDKYSEPNFESLDWWKILETFPNAQWEDIKANYTKLAQDCHPENTLDEELSQMKMRQLNWALSLAQLQREGRVDLFNLMGSRSQQDTMHRLILDSQSHVWFVDDHSWDGVIKIRRYEQSFEISERKDIPEKYHWITLEDCIQLVKMCGENQKQLKFFRERISPTIFREAIKVAGLDYAFNSR